MRLPILVIHIIGGTLGMLSGFVAVFLRKGSRWHGRIGNVFVASMLTMASAGIYLAIRKWQIGNIMGGAVTFYLVGTAWMTGRHRDNDASGKTGLLDWAGLLVASTIAIAELTFGTQAALSPTGMKYNYPPGPYFMMGTVTLLAAIGDVRMLVAGGISGTRRIARHLWRMCFGLFIAAGSIFLARQHLFPVFMRKTGMLYFLSFLPLALLIFWMIRVRLVGRFKKKQPAAIKPELSLAVR